MTTFSLPHFAEWNQRDLERNENVKFCRQYIVFHDDKSVVYSGASGNCTEIKGEYVTSLSYHLERGVADISLDLTLGRVNTVSSVCFSCQGAQ